MGVATNPVTFEQRVPAELEGGVYANFLGVWHTGHEFTLDFSATLPPMPMEDGGMTVPCRVTARIKIPPTLVFDIMRALNENMTKYEATFGPIRRPGEGEGEITIPPEFDVRVLTSFLLRLQLVGNGSRCSRDARWSDHLCGPSPGLVDLQDRGH